jgi:hypothetical protein
MINQNISDGGKHFSDADFLSWPDEISVPIRGHNICHASELLFLISYVRKSKWLQIRSDVQVIWRTG